MEDGWQDDNQIFPKKATEFFTGFLCGACLPFFSIYFVSSAVGTIIGGVGSIVGKTVSLAGQGVAAAAPAVANYLSDSTSDGNVSLRNIKNEAQQLLRETGKQDLQPDNLQNRANSVGRQAQNSLDTVMQNPMLAQQETNNLIDRLVNSGQEVFNDADREALVNVIVNRTGKSRAEAEAQVNNWQTAAREARASFERTKQEAIQQARQSGEQVASSMSKAAIFSFIGLIIGAVVAALGSGMAKAVVVSEVDEVRPNDYRSERP